MLAEIPHERIIVAILKEEPSKLSSSIFAIFLIMLVQLSWDSADHISNRKFSTEHVYDKWTRNYKKIPGTCFP